MSDDDMLSVCSQETVPFEPLPPEENIKLTQGIIAPEKTSSPERTVAPERTSSPERTVLREEDSQLLETFPNENLQNGKVNWNERIKYMNDWLNETKKICEKGEYNHPLDNSDDKRKVKMIQTDVIVEISDDEDFNQEMPKSVDSGVSILIEEREDIGDVKTTEESKQRKRKHSSNSRRGDKKLKTQTKDAAVGEDHPTLKCFSDGSIQTDLPLKESISTQTRPPFCFNAVVQTDSVIRCTKDTQTYLVSTKDAYCQTSPILPDANVGVSPMKSPQRRSNFYHASKEGRSLMQRAIDLVNCQSIKEFIMLCAFYQSLLDQNDLMMYLSNRNPNENFETERCNILQTRKMVKEKAVAHLLKVKSSYKTLTHDEMRFFKNILLECTIDWASKSSCHIKVNMNFDSFNWVTDLLNEVMNDIIPRKSETDYTSKAANVEQSVKVEVSHKSPVYGDLPPEVMTSIPLDSNVLQQEDVLESVVDEILDFVVDSESSTASDTQGDVQQDTLPVNVAVQNPPASKVSATSQVSVSQVSEHRESLGSCQALDYSRQSAGSGPQVPPVLPGSSPRDVQASCNQGQFAPANSSMVSEFARSAPSLPSYLPLVRPSCPPVVPTKHWNQAQSAYALHMQMYQQQMQRNLMSPQQNRMSPPNQPCNSRTSSFDGHPSAHSPTSLNSCRLQVRKDLMQASQRFSQPLHQLQQMQSAYIPPGPAQSSPGQLTNQTLVHGTQHPVRMSDISTQMIPLNANHQLYSGMRPQSLNWSCNGPYQPSQSGVLPPSYTETMSHLRNALQSSTFHPYHHQPQVQRPQTLPALAPSAHHSPATLPCHMKTAGQQNHETPLHNQQRRCASPSPSKPKKRLPLRRMSTSQIDFRPSVQLQNWVPVRPNPPSQQQMITQQPQSVIVLSNQVVRAPDQTATQAPLTSPPWLPNFTSQVPLQSSRNVIVTVASSHQPSTVVLTIPTPIPAAISQANSNLAPVTSSGALETLLMPPPRIPASRVRRGRVHSVDSSHCLNNATTSSGLTYTTTESIIHVPNQIDKQQTKPRKANQQSVEPIIQTESTHQEEATSKSRGQESVEQISLAENPVDESTDERQPLISPEVLKNIRKSMLVCNMCDGKSCQICAGCLSAVYCGTECAEMDVDHLCDKHTKRMINFQ